MLLCLYCQYEAKIRGGKIISVYEAHSFKEAMEKDIACECCDLYDDLYECYVRFEDKDAELKWRNYLTE